MKFGTEDRKKVIILGGLVLLIGYLFYTNVLSDSGAPPQQQARPEPAAAANARASAALPPIVSGAPATAPRRVGSRTRTTEEWHPSLRRRPEDPDPMTVDPTLRLDLLDKVQKTSLEGGSRNLFQFSTPPPPPAPKGPEPKIPVKTPAQIAQENQAKPPTVPVKPPPPPITLKYYGYVTPKSGGQKTAFFLDGEEILAGAEEYMLKRRYKVVRIGVNSVVMEDTESKSQQTLPLAEEANMG